MKLFNIISSIAIVSLIVFSFILYNSNQALESRINTLNKLSENASSEKTFKEDYYIMQQDRDTTLLLLVFPIIVGFTSLFTYANVIQKFRVHTSEIQDRIKEKETEWDKYHKKLIKLERTLNLQIGILHSQDATSHFERQEYERFAILTLSVCEKYCNALDYYSAADPERAYLIETVNLHLERLWNFLQNHTGAIVIEDVNYERYLERINIISKYLDKENLNLLHKIIGSLEISK